MMLVALMIIKHVAPSTIVQTEIKKEVKRTSSFLNPSNDAGKRKSVKPAVRKVN